MPILKVSRASRKGEGNFALKNVSFTQKKGEKVAIAGETGSGKSTLLKIVAGLAQPDSGNVFFDNAKVFGPDDQLVAGHPTIAYLSQLFELQKFLRVEQVLSYANSLAEHEATKLYEVCQIDHLVKRRTDQLSGGERQRIALAILLTKSPKLLLLDEPFTHLDMPHKTVLKEVIADISDELNISVVLVSHDPDDTLSWADKILVLKEGKVIQKGTPEEVYRKPVNEYVGGLFGKYNLVAASDKNTLKALRLKPVKGKSFFIRPEQIVYSRTGRPESEARVVDCLFYGNRFELVVDLRDKHISMVADRPIKVGQKIFVDRRPGDIPLVKTPKARATRR